MDKLIPYARQLISNDDIEGVIKVLKSDFLTQGPLLEEFEDNVSNKVSTKFAVATNSATSALHLACLAIGLSKEDIVWTSPISFSIVEGGSDFLSCRAARFLNVPRCLSLMRCSSLS